MKNINKERQYSEGDCAVSTGSVPATTTSIQVPARVTSWLVRLVQWVVMWNEKRIQRNLLNSLSEAQLKDIGLTHDDIDKEHGHKGWPNWPK